MTGFDVGPRHVGDGSPCLIIGEVAQAHEGSVMLAHSYIDAIADAGADAVKFQCHIAEAESTPDEPWRVKPMWPQDASRYDYWKRMDFSYDQWVDIRAHTSDRGLALIVSPFSVEAVERLVPLVDAWKVASGEITNDELIYHASHTGEPLIVSTGMSTDREITSVLQRLHRWKHPFALLQCTSEYPTPPEHVGLNQIQRHGAYPIGLSDHSGTIYAGLAAVAHGCDVIEVHVTLSREMQGFDTSSSITTAELRQLIEGVRWIERAKANPVDKDLMAAELAPMREIFMRKHERKALEGVKP